MYCGLQLIREVWAALIYVCSHCSRTHSPASPLVTVVHCIWCEHRYFLVLSLVYLVKKRGLMFAGLYLFTTLYCPHVWWFHGAGNLHGVVGRVWGHRVPCCHTYISKWSVNTQGNADMARKCLNLQGKGQGGAWRTTNKQQVNNDSVHSGDTEPKYVKVISAATVTTQCWSQRGRPVTTDR